MADQDLGKRTKQQFYLRKPILCKRSRRQRTESDIEEQSWGPHIEAGHTQCRVPVPSSWRCSCSKLHQQTEKELNVKTYLTMLMLKKN